MREIIYTVGMSMPRAASSRFNTGAYSTLVICGNDATVIVE
jgi:hypothetical protein